MRQLLSLLLITYLAMPGLAQEISPVGTPMGGFLIQTAMTPEGYLITNSEELKAFVTMLPKVTPFKTLPAPPNPDPFLKDYSPDFQENILVVATGRDRINDPPRFQGVEMAQDGTRLIHFVLPERSGDTFPYGWGVYSAITLPRIDAATRIVVTPVVDDEEDGWKRGEFQRAKFKRI